MKSSWKIAQVRGIVIRVHVTFPLLLLWIGVVRYLERQAWRDAVTGVLFMLALFGCVLAHELGHALVAKRCGVRTRDITLLPIGGVARLERIPRRAREELAIALAGPAVNLLVAAGILAGLVMAGLPATLETDLLEHSFLARLAWVNVALAAFNLLPAFPMDGGRVLRALLAMQTDYLRATRIAAIIGQGFAFVLGGLGLFGNPLLVLIAIFVWVGADAEARMTKLRESLAEIPVRELMLTEFHALAPDDPLQRAVDFALASRQQHFPVLAGDRLAGMLTWSDLLAGLATSGADARVGDFMQSNVRGVPAQATVERLLDRAAEEDFRALPVVQDGRVVGLFTAENLAESMLLHQAIERGSRKTTAAQMG